MAYNLQTRLVLPYRSNQVLQDQYQTGKNQASDVGHELAKKVQECSETKFTSEYEHLLYHPL